MSAPSIHVVRSNHAEVLVAALHGQLSAEPPGPFEKEWIIVQGRGMAQWLSMELARRAGIWAHAEFLYPKRFVARIFEIVMAPEVEANARDAFGREQLVWVIAAKLKARLEHPAFERLRAYVGGGTGSLRLFQLAFRIAETFDEYLTFRPELLRTWKQRDELFLEPQLSLFGQPPSADPAVWQRLLWRAITDELGSGHTAAREQKFFQALARRTKRLALPARISVFGLSSLPPLYTRVLASLAARSQVTIFQLSPCREYFGDLVGGRRKAPTLAHRENRLLVSYGALGAEFTETLRSECEARGANEAAQSIYMPNRQSALGRLQDDLLQLRDGPSAERFDLSAFDDTIATHACHSEIREVEVLHDQLLDLFERGDALPHQVVVMAPDIEAYAPLIQAVFERPASDPRRIPYRISDRNLKSDSPVLDALYRLISLANERVTVPQVLDLLNLAPVHAHFGLAVEELEQVTQWSVESGIRWGIDKTHKASFGVDTSEQNTWTFGLSRLLLGYATRADDFELVDGVLPCDLVEGKAGLVLGRFARFVRCLFELLDEMRSPRPIEEWQRVVVTALARLVVSNNDNHWEHQRILAAVADMVESARQGRFTDSFELDVFHKLLQQHFDSNREARGFLSGGVTFCALVPMRSIPFEVVYLLGMNDTAFPRSSQRADFNLLENHPEGRRLGDPNRRADDRYLFLEAILSARKRLVLSYVGQSIRDNTRRAPSVVVTELLDYLTEQYSPTRAAEEKTRERLTTFHPLQPFSPRYFTGKEANLFSYESGYLGGARSMNAPRLAAKPLFATLLDAPEIPPELSLSALTRFFAGPGGFLLRARLDVQLDEYRLQIPEREPLVLDPLEHHRLGQLALDRWEAGAPHQAIRELTRKSGHLPYGSLGDYEFNKALESTEPIAEALARLRGGEGAVNLGLRLALRPELELVGQVRELYPAGVVQAQFKRTRGRARLRAWVHHLALCAGLIQTPMPGYEPVTWLVGRAAKGTGATLSRFRAVQDPLPLLRDLLELFLLGQRYPLPFFPDTSFEFAHSCVKYTPERARLSCIKTWREELGFSASLRRLYGRDAVLTELPLPPDVDPQSVEAFRFESLSSRIYTPMLAHLDEES